MIPKDPSDSPAGIGVDTGGTFTDFVVQNAAGVRVHKVASTPDDPSRAVLAGLGELGAGSAAILHGSTVATNALLERRGARVALLTTAGFEDVLDIGRQTRASIYDLAVDRPPPLVPRERRIGVRERLDERGVVVEPLTDEEIERVRGRVARCEVDAVAICLLHAYANAEHELALARALAGVVEHLSLSSAVLPEFREYERSATTAVNAYVGPVMGRYLARLERELGGGRLRVMQSNGGIISVTAATTHAVRTILSGPAGGVVGAMEAARRSGFDHVITFDMGGTSTDVSLCPGRLPRTGDSEIGGVPIRVPMVDIHTVGAGGGSMARRDPGGSLRVGPESAGADPGPICYGAGGRQPTVTDANLLLGRLSGRHFLGGQRELDARLVPPAFETLGDELGLSAHEAAEGVARVANATMERALRVISLERGFDPADFTLVCFGGAGGAHAADLALVLGIPRVLVPRDAGVLSARGMLAADVLLDVSRSIMRRLDDVDGRRIEAVFDELERTAALQLETEGFPPRARHFERSLDARYAGQGFELEIEAGADLAAGFHAAHQKRYGYADPARAIELVTLRVRAVGATPVIDPPTPPSGDPDPEAALLGSHQLVYGGERHDGRLYDREALRPGTVLAGPAVLVEYSTTTLVPPGCRCRVDEQGSLVLEWR